MLPLLKNRQLTFSKSFDRILIAQEKEHAHVRVRIRGLKMLVFRKVWSTY